MHIPDVVVETNLEGVRLLHRGKVRDVYDLGDRLLIVATDRLSAFDVVLPTPIPRKGVTLTQISTYWFQALSEVLPNHIETWNAAEYPPMLHKDLGVLLGRSMLVKKARRVDVECVVRGYLAGAGWKEYKATGGLWGRKLPKGLAEAAKLPTPVFTPTTKAEAGAHDEPLTPEGLEKAVGVELAKRLEKLSFTIFEAASERAAKRGLILADTKFEFGFVGNDLVWIDEALTPDSSRYWEASTWQPGKTPDNFDKQFVRDYLETLKWDKKAPGPELPDEVVKKTLERYHEVQRRLCGG